MIKYVLVELKSFYEMEINPNSVIGNKIKKYNFIITVEKKGELLYWNSAKTGIPVRWIKKVIEGDISEYLLWI